MTSRIEALRIAVESRNWALVQLAVDSLEKSLTDAVEALVGTKTQTPTPAQGVTDWDSYQDCYYCKAATGHPCTYVGGLFSKAPVLHRQYPHPSRNLISDNQESDSDKLEQVIHATPPVPTSPHCTPHGMPTPCVYCAMRDHELKMKAPLTSESTASSMVQTTSESTASYTRHLTCDKLDCDRCRSEVAFPVYKDQATLDALIEADRKLMTIINEAIEKYKPRTMECPWCHHQVPENDMHTHTVKHNQEASAKPKCVGCKHCPCPESGQHATCLACDVAKPTVAHGEYEIEKSQPFPEGYMKFDILGVPFAKKIDDQTDNPRSPIPPGFDDDMKHEVACGCSCHWGPHITKVNCDHCQDDC